MSLAICPSATSHWLLLFIQTERVSGSEKKLSQNHLWQHKLKMCACEFSLCTQWTTMTTRFEYVPHENPPFLSSGSHWDKLWAELKRGQAMQMLHFFWHISGSQTACFRFTNADCVRFEGRKRLTVIVCLRRCSGYSRWELWHSLVSFCASSLTLKSVPHPLRQRLAFWCPHCESCRSFIWRTLLPRTAL